jgi:hypothetical protein
MARNNLLFALGFAAQFACFSSAALAEEKPKPIQDNSFLIEEAYNQEPNVMQSINTFTRPQSGQNWGYSLTQEFPVTGQLHQFSYTLNYLNFAETGLDATGIGDLALNYRLQAVGSGDTQVAFAPRLSLILPTGNYAQSLGMGALGYQVNLPLSLQLTPTLVGHTNLGATFTPGARNRSGEAANTLGFNVGQSFIWLYSPVFNPMLEVLWTRTPSITSANVTTNEDALVINPGFRWALNLSDGLQVVPGLAFPTYVTGSRKGETAMFLYLSFEHPMGT